MNATTGRDRSFIAAGLYGLLIGDALGVPYEFRDSSSIPPPDQIEFEPPAGFRRSHPGVAPGTWSDDGSQALCLFESLIEHPRLDLVDFADRLVRWHDHAHLQAGGRVFDVGIQTYHALARIKAGNPPHLSGGHSERVNGNGSLMRVLPIALLHDPNRSTDFDLIDKAMRQSLPTHAHPRSQLCCAQLVLWADGLRQKLHEDEAWDRAAEILTRFASGADGASDYSSFRTDLAAERQLVLIPDPGYLPHGSGYVLDSLWSARWALRGRPYEAVVRAAIQLGDDTDTTSAIAGGLAGIRDGLVAVPQRWLDGLSGRSMVEGLIDLVLKLSPVPTARDTSTEE
ncbi:MAG: ADP-ribosylglycohydrolase family protein [Rhodanobacteraceae bacterium]|nr:ADP-ribosylglycohydrolase family protein [Rhodanobacteraceae bacterium]